MNLPRVLRFIDDEPKPPETAWIGRRDLIRIRDLLWAFLCWLVGR